MESKTLLESLRLHQYEVSGKNINRDQLQYMLQLIQACEAKGSFDPLRVDDTSILTDTEIQTLKRSILDKLDSI